MVLFLVTLLPRLVASIVTLVLPYYTWGSDLRYKEEIIKKSTEEIEMQSLDSQ